MRNILLAVFVCVVALQAMAQTTVALRPITECYDANGFPVVHPAGFVGVWVPGWADPDDFVYTGPLLRPMLQDSVEFVECPDGELVTSPAVCPPD